jgi:hypothetical protein
MCAFKFKLEEKNLYTQKKNFVKNYVSDLTTLKFVPLIGKPNETDIK